MMIDLSQWRASIGLFNCCRRIAANGRGIKSFKGDSKSASPTSGKKKPSSPITVDCSLTISKDVKLSPGFVCTTGIYVQC